jgi:hypothetical protein
MANTQDSRIRLKRTSTTSTEPTVAPSSDHTDGTWVATDLYVGETYLNAADDTYYIRTDNGIRQIPIGNRAQTITAANVLNSNSSPVVLATGVAGHEWIATSAVVKIKFNSAAYDTNTNLAIKSSSASTSQLECTGVLAATGEIIAKFEQVEGGASGNVVAGDDLVLTTKGGDPVTGDSDIVISWEGIKTNLA